MQRIITRTRSALRRRPSVYASADQVVNGVEIFNTEQLARRARELATFHIVGASQGNIGALQRALARSERLITGAHRALIEDSRTQRPTLAAAEWLLDNYHIVIEQIREIRRDLPGGYYAELPELKNGTHAGAPRVYSIARELLGHTDSRIDFAAILRFVLDYQSIAPLTMGELWAVAIMLRFGLVEQLGRVCGAMLNTRATYTAADSWADRLLADAPGTTDALGNALGGLAREHPELASAFGVRLLQQLRGYDGERDIGGLLSWFEQQTIVPQHNVEALIRDASQRQAAQQAAIGNAITSMRAMNTIDWTDWFERVSLVEHALQQDPAGAYAQSTLATRDAYRHAVEDLARRSGVAEIDVARRAIEQARRNARTGTARETHVGYLLVDDGCPAFAATLGYRAPLQRTARALLLRYPDAWYLGTLAVGTAATVAAGLRLLAGDQANETPGQRLATAALLALPASAIAKELTDRMVASLLPPRKLPRLDLSDGIPAALRTIVVVPTLLLTPASVRGQIEALEVLALANTDPHLHFALLSDWADAPAAEMPNDDELLNTARTAIAQLNTKYGADRFMLLHRRRIWNARQSCFMGWERKRGKLDEFNLLLAGADDTTFIVQDGATELLAQMRYVITLDADTQLPRDVGRALIGTLAHPLNQAVIDPRTRRVVHGYGILQPRVSIALPDARRSRFAQLFSGNVGIDPYTTAVSDVYMDLFGEGIYAGKGIYDPAALRATLAHRFPDNQLLSHDLIEGSYARTGLLSDAELLDSYPATYAAFAARQHRWIRGDWQIAAWLLPWTPSGRGPARNVLSPIARFKIFDNLRRSLLPPATVVLLISGWLRGRSALATTGYALLPLALPLALEAFAVFTNLLRGPDRRLLLRASATQLAMSTQRILLNIALLPDQALTNLDAILRTLARLLLLRRNLLEWETAAAAQSRLVNSWRALLSRTAPLVAGSVLTARNAIAPAAPVITSWGAAPALIAWLDQPFHTTEGPLAADDQLLLRRLSRATWAFFEDFVTADANYLAPDNFQETPAPLIAYRTSPTNIGLQLLADLAAYDAGYIGVTELTERSERVFAALAALHHEHGHLLNWYDTRTLEPLPPAYVSTVDSGNLAGALLTLRQAYLTLHMHPVTPEQIAAGLEDALLLAREQTAADDGVTQQQIAALTELLGALPTTLTGCRPLLERVQMITTGTSAAAAGGWLTRIAAQAGSFLRDLDVGAGADWPGQPAEMPRPYDARPAALVARHAALADEAFARFMAMDFAFLYDERRYLFSIGHSFTEGRRDASYYDLLASEARLASFLAIAKGDVPQEHWFHLGRTRIESGVGPVLASWSGTMFEYLMPLLLMRSYPETLLDTSYHTAVARQIQYGRAQKIPWGVSESAFNTRDPAMNYQYHAFGVPGLGLKRGLANDTVIAPYATALALLVQPKEALANLRTLLDAGIAGRYGLYEAVDYTPERLPPGASHAIVRSYMVHHQGMSLLAFASRLQGERMQQRFHTDPLVQATETLLQERVISGAPLFRPPEVASVGAPLVAIVPAVRHVTTPTTAVPFTHVLSNGTYSVMLTNAGGGYSICDNLSVTRWRADVTRDNWGSFCYLRDARSGLVWSAAYQPTRHVPQDYRVIFGLDKVEYRQQTAGIESRLEVTVSPEDNVEVRHLTLVNLTSAPREIEVTSYAEVVLATPAADAAHPAFSNLFVETEFVAEHDALLASRRPRSASAARQWAVHVVAVRGHASETEFETDRAAFVGRGRTTANPQALHGALEGHAGAVLDPIFSLRRRVRIAPGGSAQVTFTTGIVPDREQALRLADRYRAPEAASRALAMAWSDSQIELRHLNISAADAQRFQRLAAAAIYLDPTKRARPELLARNTRGQSGLWAFGISGDDPIVLVRVAVGADLTLVQELLQAHQYWRLNRLAVDLVLINEGPGGYLQTAHDHILALVRGSGSGAWLNQRGGIYVLRTDLLSEADDILLQTTARAVLSTDRGGLAQHLRRREPDAAPQPALPYIDDGAGSRSLPPIDLVQRTAYGGFDTDGTYVIDVLPGETTPAPWSNVIANARAGFLITERGGGYTWASNSRENRLTPWSNDPVSDPVGEALYLRDAESGAIWSPLPQPAGNGPVRVRHAPGLSTFTRERYTIASEVRLSIPHEDPVKLVRLRLTNTGDTPRQLSATFYVEWVLGVLREQNAPFVITTHDETSGALLARNPYNTEFASQVAFLACDAAQTTVSGDRVAFVGRNGDLVRPAALASSGLDGRVGAGFDPCGAVQCALDLNPGETREIVFLLGQGDDLAETQALIARYRAPGAAAAAEQQTVDYWQALLGQVRVETPMPGFDLLLNGWLMYQTLACRILARSAFYQSGGAYGFRDQLQDVMALSTAAPEVARAQILRAAARQFVEGDVQHWWHPPTGRGVRTRFSDDYLWLPFVVDQYTSATGDQSVLDEIVPYIEGRSLAEGEGEYYDLPVVSRESGPVYEHIVRTIDLALTRIGVHGLPLIGVGDWNDGMSMVGHHGRGESVWVAWFLHGILTRTAVLADTREEEPRAVRYRAAAAQLIVALETHGWDGEWYRRAYYDDGTPLGSASRDEAQIDSLVQSWAVISGAGDAARARKGMAAADVQLVSDEAGLIKLFTPPFDKSDQDPGYIKGYVPGVRENGGQYTHAAIWMIWAYALLGDGARVGELINLINPVRHASQDAARYVAEPYVIAADVYAVPPHTGRGGWTWYTGSAGWLQRLGIEMLLGLRRNGDLLTLVPCIPPAWPGYQVWYRHGTATYHIQVRNPDGVATGIASITLDGAPVDGDTIPLHDDGATHIVAVVMGTGAHEDTS